MNTLRNHLQTNNQPIPCLFYPAARELDISIHDLLTDAEKQAQVLAYIADHYNVGAVVRMTELWCEAASFGMDISISDTNFPKLGEPLYEDPEDMEEIALPPVINPVTEPLIEAVKAAVPQMAKPLIVGVTGPYTLGSVLNGSENFMVNCMMEPEIMGDFLDQLTDFLIGYILEYKKAGACGVMIAEPSTGMISPDMMEEYSNQYIRKIVEQTADENFAVIYHNCGDVNAQMDVIAKLPADGFHFGSSVDMEKAMAAIPDGKLLMGNIEPQLFLGSDKDAVTSCKDTLLNTFEGNANFRLSTGCDLSPAANPDLIQAIF